MITPDEDDDLIPLDDSQDQDSENSAQQDIHSNGFDDENTLSGSADMDDDADPDQLQQAYDAAEPAYTLNLDDDGNEKDDE